MLKTLVDLGFELSDAQIYVFIAKRGQQKALDICRDLKINKQQLYPCLKKLESKGIVTATFEHPAKFSAIPFEKVLDLFIKAKMEEARSIRESKNKILANWRSLQIGEPSETGGFTIIEGRNYIYSRIQQMIQEANSEVATISSAAGLIRADQFGIFDPDFAKTLSQNFKFRLLTESPQNVGTIKDLIVGIEKAGFSFEGRIPEIGLRLFPRMVMKDDKEVMFFITPRPDTLATEQDEVCLWTNCHSLVQAFKGIFDELWRNGSDIKKTFDEVEVGGSALKTKTISESAIVKKIYAEALNSARREVFMMTSSEDLLSLSEDKDLLRKWADQNVSIKIMAPIIGENLEAEQEMSNFCEVKHVPESLLRTTLIDGLHFFQFGNSPKENLEGSFGIENAFYTNDVDYVKKAQSSLEDVWKNSSAPSGNTLEAYLKPFQPELLNIPEKIDSQPNDMPDKPLAHSAMRKVGAFKIEDEKPLTEKDLLDKILHGKKYVVRNLTKDLTRTYGNDGQAVIHPPKFLNLPDIMIHAFHNDKQSSYGNEDYIIIYLWLPTPKGKMFVPVAVVGDIQKGEAGLRMVWAGTPAGRNVQIVKKDQLQVQLHGNSFFAGWTVPIPLLPSPSVLPPSAIMLEAFGKLKTGKINVSLPSGCKVTVEQNCFEAFVTFFHPASKYSGPGTDGIVNRELIMTTTPPTNVN